MIPFQLIADKFEPKLLGYTNFKIGKTEQPIEERYNQVYSQLYSAYAIVGSADNRQAINHFESYMIKRFVNFPNCDNTQIDSSKMRSSKHYIVYVVYNE